MDAVLLARIQFAVTIIYHFLFVPLSIGVGALLVIAERRYYKTGREEDKAASDFWIKIFTATFAVGVATGISMEFAFGTNWSGFSRFVGNIFGAPLAAEALFSFFLESSFLAVLLFGRSRVSKKFFYVSSWLVWIGSLTSALWIIIAGSWMQTPAGYKLVDTALGTKAVMTDFFAASLNHSTLARYFHTVDSIMILGGFIAMAIAAYYMLQGRHKHFAKNTMIVGAVIALISSILILPLGHWQAGIMAKHQPSKLAAFEGHWDSGPMALNVIGWVDETNEKTYALGIPGGIGLLTELDANKSYPGIHDIRKDAEKNNIPDGGLPPLNFTFQAYRIMLLLYPLMLVGAALAVWYYRKGGIENRTRFLKYLVIAPLFPMIAIQFGWAAAEVGRQPWTVYNLLLTKDAVSVTVPAYQVLITLIGFTILYTGLYYAWWRVVAKMIKTGPVLAPAPEVKEVA